MKAMVSFVVIASVVFLMPVFAESQTAYEFDFMKGKAGQLPAGWKAFIGGQDAKECNWQLVEDKVAPGGGLMLHQTLSNPKGAFNICLSEGAGRYKDVDVSVAVKAFGGKNAQGGGLIWRTTDADNGYALLMSPAEKNLSLFKTVKGVRLALKKVDLPEATADWHALRVIHLGDKIQCYFDGKLKIECTDKEFESAGRIGVATNGDSETYFAHVRVVGTKE